MKKLIYGLGVIFIIIGLTGCKKELTPENLKTWKQKCSKKSKINTDKEFIFSNGECIEYYVAKGNNNDSVIVILHGSHTSGGNPLSWMPKWADFLSEETDITTYIVNMPGYGMSSSNRFFKMIWSKGDIAPAQLDFIEFSAELLKSIKKKENAKNLYVVGHSSGADLAAVIPGQTPGLIQKSIPFAGAYDFPLYVGKWNGWDSYHYISAVDYIDKIQNTKFLLLAGQNDPKSWPMYTKHFEKKLKEKNVNVKKIILPNVTHQMSQDVWDKVANFIIDGKLYIGKVIPNDKKCFRFGANIKIIIEDTNKIKSIISFDNWNYETEYERLLGNVNHNNIEIKNDDFIFKGKIDNNIIKGSYSSTNTEKCSGIFEAKLTE